MREAMVIMPQTDNASRSLAWLANEVMGEMVDTFGGVTMREARGGWRGGDGKLYMERVVEFVAAYDPEDTSLDAALNRIAHKIGTKGQQLAVYVRYASGDVEIMDTAEAGKVAA